MVSQSVTLRLSTFELQTSLDDGTAIRLRPIRLEDEPLWHRLLADCSTRTLWQRFRYTFREATHEMAVRFCTIDFDRTMAIVAEVEVGGEKRLIGVGRLAADAGHRCAEYAVLVADAWQGRGLGGLLTDRCLELCRAWDIDRVVATTTADNAPMLRIFLHRGFAREQTAAGEVQLHLDLQRPDRERCS